MVQPCGLPAIHTTFSPIFHVLVLHEAYTSPLQVSNSGPPPPWDVQGSLAYIVNKLLKGGFCHRRQRCNCDYRPKRLLPGQERTSGAQDTSKKVSLTSTLVHRASLHATCLICLHGLSFLPGVIFPPVVSAVRTTRIYFLFPSFSQSFLFRIFTSNSGFPTLQICSPSPPPRATPLKASSHGYSSGIIRYCPYFVFQPLLLYRGFTSPSAANRYNTSNLTHHVHHVV